jgi:hypothetical protein
MIKPLMSEIMRFMDASRKGINVKDYAGHVISFLCVPCSSSDNLFSNSKSWFDEALQISGSAHNGTFEVHSMLQIICADKIREARQLQVRG